MGRFALPDGPELTQFRVGRGAEGGGGGGGRGLGGFSHLLNWGLFGLPLGPEARKPGSWRQEKKDDKKEEKKRKKANKELRCVP